MKTISRKALNLVAFAGLLIGVAGFVRTSSIVIGVAVFITGLRQQRKIERYLAMAIGLSLLIVAIALPHGR